jgi:hypothetical protein
VYGDSRECARWLLVHCRRRVRDLQVLWLGARAVSDAGTYSGRRSAEHVLEPRGEPGEQLREPVQLLRRVRLLPRHRPVLELHDEPLQVGKPLQCRRDLR